jgi:hypothetical protein
MSSVVSDHPLPLWIFQMLDILENNDVPASYCWIRVREYKVTSQTISVANSSD